MRFARLSCSSVVLASVVAVAVAWCGSVAIAAETRIVVVKAVYGDLPDGNKTDVTEKVAAMVKDGMLSVQASNDAFGDPADGVLKKLQVDYTINGVAGSKTVNENESLIIVSPDKLVRGKLVILRAFYGDLPSGAKTDVTEKVAGMVKEKSLAVDASNDNFGDPADGVLKKLQVDYALDGVPGSKTVSEGETLVITAGKLVITKAFYGDLPDGSKVDVTEKVAAMIKDGALSVEASNDNFTDPAVGVAKKLKVDYTYDGAEKSKTVEENATLTISNTGE